MTHKVEFPHATVVVIEGEAPAVCEDCGVKDELRPYGKIKPDGHRMRVCFDCAMKNPVQAARGFQELFRPGR